LTEKYDTETEDTSPLLANHEGVGVKRMGRQVSDVQLG